MRTAVTFNRVVITVCICALALVNLQCGQDRRENGTGSSTLTIHVPDLDERALGPAGYRPSSGVWFLVFLGLTVDPDGSEVLRPRLLDRWDHTPDYVEWSGHVREGVRWDDGVPVTAEDVKFSLELWTDEEVWYEHPSFEEIRILDEQTFQVIFKEPVTRTISTFDWLPMLPKHLLETLEPERIFSWPFWIQPVGNGPYRYRRHVPAVMTEFAVNPDYYGNPPNVPRVVLRYGGNGLTELLSGNVDVASRLTPMQALQLAEDSRFRLYHSIAYRSHVAIVWNHRIPMFQDADVRKALTMAIDRRELNRTLNHPDDAPIFDVPATRRHHLRGVVPDPLPFAPERAARLLASAGWVDTNNDGIREKDGQDFQLTLSTTEKTAAQAVYIQEQFRRAGVRMEISTYDRNVLMPIIQETHDFDAAIHTYNHLKEFGEFRASGYENPEASRLQDIIWFTIDQEEADKHLREFWRIFEEEMPITYLHPMLSYTAVHRRVRGMRNDTDLFSLVEHLSIEDGSGKPIQGEL